MAPSLRRHHDDADADVAETSSPAVALAPVWVDPYDAEPAPAAHVPAPVYPTEADEAEAIAELLDADPTLRSASTHVLARSVKAQLVKNANRAAKRQRTLATTLDNPLAPVFPTESHALDLLDAIPTISGEEIKAVLAAGHDAYLASLDAGEPITTAPPTQER